MVYSKPPFNKLLPVPFYKVKIIDNFWEPIQKLNSEISIPLQFKKLEADHHIDNFRVAAKIKKGIHIGEFYFDSDLYKWLEAASYVLHIQKDYKLKEKVKKTIELIFKAQMEDGYVNTYLSTKSSICSCNSAFSASAASKSSERSCVFSVLSVSFITS